MKKCLPDWRNENEAGRVQMRNNRGPSILTYLVFSILIFGGIDSVDAQKNYYEKYYEDQIEKGSEVLYADIQTVKEITKDKKYFLKIFYPETKQLTHRIEYANELMTGKHGRHTEYYDNGNLWKDGQNVKGKMSGEWKFYTHKDGRLSYYGNYELGLQEGEWITLDSLENPVSFKNYVAGKLDGDVYEINGEGDTILFEKYKAGELVEKIISKEEVPLPDKMPMFPGCEESIPDSLKNSCAQQKMLIYIYSNIKYPHSAMDKNISGSAIIHFKVKKDGSVSDIITYRGICQSIERECIRLVRSMPKWEPGYKNGEAVDVEFTLPIRFKLD